MKRSPMRRKALKPKRRKHPMGSLGVSAVKKGPWENDDHLEFVRSFPCLVCLMPSSEAHHIRELFPRTMGLQIGDEWTVPMCRRCHTDVHIKSRTFWTDRRIDPISTCKFMQSASKHWQKVGRMDWMVGPTKKGDRNDH